MTLLSSFNFFYSMRYLSKGTLVFSEPGHESSLEMTVRIHEDGVEHDFETPFITVVSSTLRKTFTVFLGDTVESPI